MLEFYGKTFESRLLLGTAQYPSPAILADAVRASGCGIVTVSLRRESGEARAGQDFWALIRELGVAAVAHGGALYKGLFESRYPSDLDVVEATEAAFVEAADMLEATDFADACPLATIALEVANTDEPMRIAAAAAFESWLAVFEQRFLAAGMKPERAREVAINVFCLIEGAALLARTTRSPVPMHLAGKTAAKAVAAGLAEGR